MNYCGDSEQLIAQFVEGDLPASGVPALEKHISRCANCRELVEDLRESQRTFKNMRQTALDDAVLRQIRTRILDNVRAIDTSWMLRLDRFMYQGYRRTYALAGLALLILFAGSLWYVNRPVDLPLPPIAQPLGPPEIVPEPPVSVPAPVQAAAARPQPRVRPAEPVAPAPPTPGEDGPGARVRAVPGGEPRDMLVKLLTDDPTIVIYWLIEQNGGDE